MPVETFCALYGFKQGTVSSWITRNKTVDSLPVTFIYCLGLASSKPMDFVYQKLLDYEEPYLIYLGALAVVRYDTKKLEKKIDMLEKKIDDLNK